MYLFRYLTLGDLDNYTKLCSIEADLSHLPLTAQEKLTGEGTFYRLHSELVLLFGLTEMKAQVIYKGKVSEKDVAWTFANFNNNLII